MRIWWKRPEEGGEPGIRKRLMLFLAVLGPGIITANVDNDAGGIATYSIVGADYGYTLLWSMVPVTIALVVVQEMCSRMGAVTGKGLADLIRENYGVKVTFYTMWALFLTNIGNTIAEFAGIAASLDIFGVDKFLSVPVAALFVWFIVVKGSYKVVEKIFLVACLVYVAYPISAILAKPDWLEVIAYSVPHRIDFAVTPYIVMIIGIVGTTIAPWMQFYLQSAVVEKGVTADEYRYCRYDVVAGCIVAALVAIFIVIACGATLYKANIPITTAADAALALRPLAGKYASLLFSFGLFNASLFAASILPLSTAYSVCEGLGWETGINKRFEEAPQFYSLFTAILIIGAAAVLIPNFPLFRVMVISQVVNGMLLPIVLFLMLQLVNREEIMGKFVNSRFYNRVTWLTILAMVALTAVMLVSLLSGDRIMIV